MKRRAVQTDAAGPLDETVARGLGCPLDEARTLVARGAVYVRGRRQREAALAIPAGSPVLVVLEERGRSSTAPEPSAPPAPGPRDATLPYRMPQEPPPPAPTEPGPATPPDSPPSPPPSNP